MRLVKIGLASVNNTVGAFAANVDRAIRIAGEMAVDGVTLGVFQEQLVGGYPVEDLVQWQGFVEGQWPQLERFAAATAELPAVFVCGVSVMHNGLRYNCAAPVAGGKILGLVPKEKLPTYNIYYEGRTFSRGVPGMAEEHRGVALGDMLFRFDFGIVAVEVCEDLWSADGPIKRRTYSGAELSVNLSASVFRVGIVGTRRELIATRAGDHQCTIAYTNAIGANDGLIFDGGGFVNQNGKPMLEAPRFREGFASVVVDLDRTARLRAEATTWRSDQEDFARSQAAVPIVDVPAATFTSQREGLTIPSLWAGRSFCRMSGPGRVPGKSCARRSSMRWRRGGRLFREDGRVQADRDRALRGAGLAVDAAGGAPVREQGAAGGSGVAAAGVYDAVAVQLPGDAVGGGGDLPGPGGEAGGRADRGGVWARTRGGARDAGRGAGADRADEAEHPGAVAGAADVELVELFRRPFPPDREYEREGGRVHDGRRRPDGGVGVLANVPKTVVMYLLDYLHEKTGYRGIEMVLAKQPGPELAPNQVGEEELMPFPILDACFHLFAAETPSRGDRGGAGGDVPGGGAGAAGGVRHQVHAAVPAVDL